MLGSAGAADPVARHYFAPPDYEALALNADGTLGAWFRPVASGRTWQLRVGEIESSSSRLVGTLSARPRQLYWLDDDSLLVDAEDIVHGRSWFRAVISSGHLTPLFRASSPYHEGPRLVSLAVAGQGVVLMSDDARVAFQPDLYRVDLRRGVKSLQEKNPGGVFRWFADRHGRVRLASRWESDGAEVAYELLYRERSYDRWQSIHRYALGQRPITPLGFSRRGERILVSAVGTGDTAALQEFDPIARRLGEVLFHSPAGDVGSVIYAGGAAAPAMIEYEGLRPQRAALDSDWRRHLALLDARVGGVAYSILQTSADARYALVYAYGDREPGRYLRFDADRGDLLEIGRRLPRLDARELRPTRALQFPARDGLPLSAYLTAAADAEGSPLLVLVHGGPWSRDRWGFHAGAQYLANRGISVLQVNFRGSRGLGHRLLHAGRGAWGEAMIDDLIDGLDAVAADVGVDSERVCVMGASYGGYAALMASVRAPSRFRCAVAAAPVSDIGAQMRDFAARGNDRGYAEWRYMVGDPERSPDDLQARSPLHRFDDIRIPVYLAHGARDRVVDPAHSRALASRLQQHDADATLAILPASGHDLGDPDDRIRYFQSAASFILEHTAIDQRHDD